MIKKIFTGIICLFLVSCGVEDKASQTPEVPSQQWESNYVAEQRAVTGALSDDSLVTEESGGQVIVDSFGEWDLPLVDISNL